MLILALGAVVVGCVFLVVSFITENTGWAWGCIAACGLAAVILVVDTIRRGRAHRGATATQAAPEAVTGTNPAEPTTADAAEPVVDSPPAAVGDAPPAAVADSPPAAVADSPPAAPPTQQFVAEPVQTPVQPPTAPPAPDEQPTEVLPAATEARDNQLGDSRLGDREPDEEDVDAADALAVGGLSDEVVVVDEHPRFHLPSCPWLHGKPVLPLPISEAVELGFTGCARCRPSTAMATKSRAR